MYLSTSAMGQSLRVASNPPYALRKQCERRDPLPRLVLVNREQSYKPFAYIRHHAVWVPAQGRDDSGYAESF